MNAPGADFWLQQMAMLGLEALLVVLAALGCQRVISSAGWRRTIWQVTLLGLGLVLVMELSGIGRGISNWAKSPDRAGQTAVQNQVQQSKQPRPSGSSTLPEFNEARPPLEMPLHPADLIHPHASFDVPLPVTTPTTQRQIPTPASTDLFWPWMPALVWLLVLAGLAGRTLFGRFILTVFSLRCQRVNNEELSQRVSQLARRMGLRRQIRLIESAKLSGPVAFGLLRPCIGLPRGFAQDFGPVQQEAMLAHELAHLLAHDAAWHFLADLTVAALWWHPLVWVARKQFLKASEAAADEACLVVSGGQQVLAECLVSLASRLTATPSASVLGLGGRGFKSGLGQRVQRLMGMEAQVWQPPNQLAGGLVRLSAPLVLAGVVILGTGWMGKDTPQTTSRNTGDSIMNTLQQSWKRSAAALVLAVAVGADEGAARVGESAPASAARKPPLATSVKSGPVQPGRSSDGVEASALRAKLESIVLPEVAYDGLPLSEVIKQLMDMSVKLSTDKVAVNFLYDFNSSLSAATPTIDPNTGLPTAAAEMPDLASIAIRIDPKLHNVRMIDVLDAITKVAGRPIRYRIEDYAVVISLIPAQPSPLTARFYKVDPLTFFPDVERVFGVKISSRSAEKLTADLKHFLKRVGVEMDEPNKAVFFNDRIGMLMVKALPEELEIVDAAIATLGGDAVKPASQQPGSAAKSEPGPATGVAAVAPPPLVVQVTTNAPYFELRGQPVTYEQLQKELTSLGQSSPKTAILIQAGEGVPFREVVKVMDAVKAAKLTETSLRTF